jgi:hypothetical protein
MFDKHIDILAFKAIKFTVHQTQVTSITVTTDSTKWTELCQAVGHLNATYIASMPYLITGLKIMQIFIVPVAVCITDDADSFHWSDGC